MGFAQYLLCVVEAVEKRAMPSLLARRKQSMLSRNISCVFRKTIRTEYFTADWANELSVCPIALKTKEAKNSALAFLRRNYCSCH